jgi:hypothetical protein
MSSDAPVQTVLQQREARPVSGEHLEVLGKKAAADWCAGKVASLNAAVVGAVQHEMLSPEQVKRVVEFCNQDAYLQEFRKEGTQHRVVHFDTGPADPAQVIQDLNDGGGGSRFDRGTLDYSMPPSLATKEASWRSPVTVGLDKTASVAEAPAAALPRLVKLPSLPKMASPMERYESQLWEMLGNNAGAQLPMAEPLRPLQQMEHKLAGAAAHLDSEVDSLEVEFGQVTNRLYDTVKQAALDGVPLGAVVTAWSTVSEDPLYVKVAFNRLTPLLQAGQVFDSLEQLGNSLLKTAGFKASMANSDHPVVATYREFVDTLNKLASTRAVRDELQAGANEAHALLKQAASGGLVGAAKRGAGLVSSAIDKASPAVAHALVGSQEGKKLAPTISKALKGTALVGTGLAANAAVQNVTDRPAVRGAVNTAASIVPGTMAYQQRRYNTMTGQ